MLSVSNQYLIDQHSMMVQAHVLTMCSRPDGFEPVTKPGIYKKAIAPLYFHLHKHSQVAKFFKDGGHQYLYAEDMLILEKAKIGMVPIPPLDTTTKNTLQNAANP